MNSLTDIQAVGTLTPAPPRDYEQSAPGGMDSAAMAAAASEASDLLRLLANTNRLLILCFLLEGENSVGEMEQALGIRQPTLSQQIAVLREARLIQQSRREAKVVFYRLRDRKVIPIIETLYGVFCSGALLEDEGTEPVSALRPVSVPGVERPAPGRSAVAGDGSTIRPALPAGPVASGLAERSTADCGVMASVTHGDP